MILPKNTYLISNYRLVHIAKELQNRAGRDAVLQAKKSSDLTEQDFVAAKLGQKAHRIDGHKEALFLNAAIEILKDTSFAASAGLCFNHHDILGAYVGKYSENIGAALKNAQKYIILDDENFSYQIKISSNSVSLVLKSNELFIKYGDRLREFLVFSLLSVLRDKVGQKFNPLKIRFEHNFPDSNVLIQQLVGCPVLFDSPETEIVIPFSTLELPISTYDPSLLIYLEDYGNGLLAELKQPQPKLRVIIEKLLFDNLPDILTVQEVADSLAIGSRTLARRLTEEDLTFSVIVQDFRSKIAFTYLAQDQVPISEIAFLLGYANQSSFTSAFRRWTGQTPNSVRAQ